MTLLMSSWTRTAKAMAEGERGSSLCWLVDDPSPLLYRGQGSIMGVHGGARGREGGREGDKYTMTQTHNEAY